MHFLCLHGMGTNSEIFEMQTATIRYELGDNHTYSFVEGTVPHPMAPGIAPLTTPTSQFFAYIDQSDPSSCLTALSDLAAYVASTGPYDGLFGFSEGAGLAATLMAQRMRADPRAERTAPLFKCAVFFSGGVPADAAALAERGEVRLLSAEVDGVVIEVPTAHVWGRNDGLYPTFGPVLAGLCAEGERAVVVHGGGHEVPGGRDASAVREAVRAIRRTVERALEAQ